MESKKNKDVTTSKHAARYFVVGISLALFNYVIYSILANFVIDNNDFLWLSTLISTTLATILAYILHSKITWKERTVTKAAIIKFFIWNALAAFMINPILTQVFSYLTHLYDFAYSITSALGLDFTYEFVLSTGAFLLTACVTMVLNFLFYDRFVFGKQEPESKPNAKLGPKTSESMVQ